MTLINRHGMTALRNLCSMERDLDTVMDLVTMHYTDLEGQGYTNADAARATTDLAAQLNDDHANNADLYGRMVAVNIMTSYLSMVDLQNLVATIYREMHD